MVAVVCFCLAGVIWLWVLVSTLRARDEPQRTRLATFVGLGVVAAAVAAAYVLYAR
ncbi:MAG TPA: hypothetical protein VFO60_07735 [Candidatus Dormibacteraeota bacterium]|nr:hypothetical protein [Candidatus Dormibacteraeota bacterium]